MIAERYKSATLVILFFIAITFSLSGCAASSSTIRYNDKDSEKNVVKKTAPQKEFHQSVDSTGIYDFLDEEEFVDYAGTEEKKFDISEVVAKIRKHDSELLNSPNSHWDDILMQIIEYLDTPYRFGGNSKDGIDCSAFTQTVFQNAANINLLRTARDQYTQGIVIENKEDLKFGDLVFFNTRRAVRPGHVGIYLGENLFAHASRKLGVTISTIENNYYSKRFMGGRRIEEVSSTN
ncbi:MAG: hypothetical protein C0425_07240 [Chlorobiaceae bacterium]|nr:hypothetical protein [Chlorobiaceae bacterium]MBA4310118.1 hypothetical protein [Chlorobiaceae bacterium]